MSDNQQVKPMEWVDIGKGLVCMGSIAYLIWPVGRAWYRERGDWKGVPGPYDGTIETAKQRCEEHRAKMREGKQ